MGSTSYLARGKAGGGGRPVYGTYRPTKSASSVGSDRDTSGKLKRSKPRRSGKAGEFGLKRSPDYTELAYKEAVSRLRYFLSGNLAHGYRSYGGSASIKNLDESDAEDKKYHAPAPFSLAHKPRLTAKYTQLYADSLHNYNPNDAASKASSGAPAETSANPDVVHFIQKQEEYIEQLERESQYCRDELNTLLGKVKEVISENEHLHEAQKNKMISRMFESSGAGASDTDEQDERADSTGLDSDHRVTPSKMRKSSRSARSTRLEGPNIVFESRIAELDAQLAQANIQHKKLQDENNENKRKLAAGLVDSSCLDGFKRQIDNLQRDKASLEAQVSKLRLSLEQSDSELGTRLKRGSDVVEQQLREERNNLEAEVRRLKEELNSQRGKVRELTGEGARRAVQERSAAEQRYTVHLDELAHDLAAQYDNVSKLQLDLERQRRDEHDLKRELAMKTAAVDELKMELKSKTASLQADLAQAHAEKSSVEEELASARLAIERHQRQAKHETNRLNSEIQSLRQRLDRADADLVHSRRENLRLSEEIAKLEKDLKLGNLTPASPVKSNKDKELASMLETMENKHAHTVAELEAMIQSQNSLMDKLTGECRLLTDKLDHASRRHKEELAALQRQVEGISQNFQQSPSLHNAPTFQAPTTHTINHEDDGRTQAFTGHVDPRADATRISNINRQSPESSHRNDGNGPPRTLKKQPSNDSLGNKNIAADNQSYLNQMHVPPDKFEEKADESTEKDHKFREEHKYMDTDLNATDNNEIQGAGLSHDQEYPAESQYTGEAYSTDQNNFNQPHYQTQPEAYASQEVPTTISGQAYDQEQAYNASEYNQGDYSTEYTEGQYESQAQYPNQEYTEMDAQGYSTEQNYDQQQYDYNTNPDLQIAGDPNYQSTADPNNLSIANPNTLEQNYPSPIDTEYLQTSEQNDPNAYEPKHQSPTDPTYQSTDYERSTDQNYQRTADINYQGSADPNYQSTVDPNYPNIAPTYESSKPYVENQNVNDSPNQLKLSTQS